MTALSTSSDALNEIIQLNQQALNGPYGQRLSRAITLWDEAANRHNSYLKWLGENPRPEGKWDSPEFLQWKELENAHRRANGWPEKGSDPGRILHDGRHHHMKLRAPIRNPETDEVVYGYVSRCAHCGNLIASTKNERYCSNVCRHVAEANIKAEAKARRAEDRAEMSDALADRRGICLSCGTDFNLKRTTAKVCSERCKKQLQRKPELLAEQLSDRLPDLNDSYGQWKEQMEWSRQIRMAGLFGGSVEQDKLDLAHKISDECPPLIKQERVKRCLHAAASEAPALTAWLLGQPEEVVEEAFGIERNYVLGAALVRKLRKQELVK